MIFWTAVAGAAIIVILLVLRPLLRGASEAHGEHTPEVDIYKDQLGEVERDIARGVISEADAEAAKTEIARRLLAAAEAQDAADTKIASAGTVGAAVIGVSALAISLAAYSYTGSPHLPDQPKSERAAQAQADPDLNNLVFQSDAPNVSPGSDYSYEFSEAGINAKTYGGGVCGNNILAGGLTLPAFEGVACHRSRGPNQPNDGVTPYLLTIFDPDAVLSIGDFAGIGLRYKSSSNDSGSDKLFSSTVSTVPLPASALLMLGALGGLAFVRRKIA